MTRDERPPGGSTPVLVRVVVGVLLAAPFVAYLSIPSYNRIEPRLGGFPFFYWWQLMWVVLTGVFIWVAFLLTRVARTAAPASRAPDRPAGGNGGAGEETAEEGGAEAGDAGESGPDPGSGDSEESGEKEEKQS